MAVFCSTVPILDRFTQATTQSFEGSLNPIHGLSRIQGESIAAIVKPWRSANRYRSFSEDETLVRSCAILGCQIFRAYASHTPYRIQLKVTVL